VDRVEDGADRLTARDDAIAVIGGGWAGCAAAVALAARGVRVELFESSAVLGGRARRVERAGLALDNGQHVLVGAYDDALAMIATVHDGNPPVARLPLTIAPLARRQSNGISLRARRWRAPFGLLAALATARGLAVRERIAAIRWFTALARRDFACPSEQTVAGLLSPLPRRVASSLWAPLCVAALNTPIATASASVFANVLRVALSGRTERSDFVLPATDLSSLFPDAAARYVAARGGRVTTSAHVTIDSIDERAVTLRDGERTWSAAAAIVAVGPHQLAGAFSRDVAYARPAIADALAACARLGYEPIATVYLGYRERFALPCAITRLDDAPGQWVFDRDDILRRSRAPAAALAQLVAVVISASGAHDALDRDALVAACDAQLRRLAPRVPPLAWSQPIVERRATYACVPGRPRPPHVHVAANVALAGDYLHPAFPATLEAAVQAGIAAARALG
jgi:squalene-associated FAD-dependent desaturase